MAPGRAMTNAGVARALGWTSTTGPNGSVGFFTTQSQRPSDGWINERDADFLHDDALALRVLVPWLRKKGLTVQITYYQDGTEAERCNVQVAEVEYRGFTRLQKGQRSADEDTLAHACCQVVLAIAEGKD